jgi:hypothetical protein
MTSRHPARWFVGLALLVVVAPVPAQAPEPVRLSAVLGAFLADSGVPTRALPWTTGGGLPIRWSSPGPVATNEQWLKNLGMTHTREGAFVGLTGDSVALPMTIHLRGTTAGLGGVSIGIDNLLVETPGGSYFVTRELIEKALTNEGAQLRPLKCSRETEGASYGNLVDAFRMPGKNASGLWWMWQAPMQELQITLTLLYRRADLAQVECAGG